MSKLFSRKNKKININLSSAESTWRVVKVKYSFGSTLEVGKLKFFTRDCD